MDHGGLVAEACLLHPEAVVGDEFFRHGKLEWTGRETLGEGEIQRGGDAGVARIRPVGVPGAVDRELEPEGEGHARLDRRNARDEAGLDVLVPHGRRLGESGPDEESGEGEKGKAERSHGGETSETGAP